MEEPRVRVRREVFKGLESRYGPFTEMIGPERTFARRTEQGESKAIWAHPTYDTVGSALGRIGERLDPNSPERLIERVGARPVGPSGGMVAARPSFHMRCEVWGWVETSRRESGGTVDQCVGSPTVNGSVFPCSFRYCGPPRRRH